MDERPFQAVLSPDDRVLTLIGVIDELAVDQLREVLRTGTRDHSEPLTVDLSDVDFLPSMALGVLISAMRDSGGQLSLSVRRKCIARRVLEVTGLPHVVTS